MRRNLGTTIGLRAGRRAPMEAYDDAPPELRRWLAAAALPWSVEAAMRRYTRELRRCRGDRAAALARMDAREAQALAEDARRVWGPDHPCAVNGSVRLRH
jgi:hypothetical protein